MRYSKRTTGLILWISIQTSVLSANGLIRDGVGATSMGRAGVNLGYADSGAIILDNPAAMSNIGSTGLFDVSVDTLICDVTYRDAENLSPDPSLNGYPLGTIGYIRRSPESPWSWGIGAYAPAGFGAGFNLVNPDTGPARYKSFGALAKLLPAVAYEVNDRLSIGASFGLAISHVELEGPFYIQTGPFAGTPSLIDLQFTGTAPAATIGLQYKLTPATVLGVSYTEETRFVFNGDARAQIGPFTSSFDAEMDLVWPRSLGIGIMHDFNTNTRGGFDLIWYDWSHAFSELPLTLRNPSDPFIAGLLGPELRDAFPLAWRDTLTYRFAYEYSPSELLVWRAGYLYHDSPVPNSTLNPYLDGVLEHAVTLGVSRRVRSAWLNVGYQYAWSPERNVVDSVIVGGDTDNSSLRAQAHWISMSLVTQF